MANVAVCNCASCGKPVPVFYIYYVNPKGKPVYQSLTKGWSLDVRDCVYFVSHDAASLAILDLPEWVQAGKLVGVSQ